MSSILRDAQAKRLRTVVFASIAGGVLLMSSANQSLGNTGYWLYFGAYSLTVKGRSSGEVCANYASTRQYYDQKIYGPSATCPITIELVSASPSGCTIRAWVTLNEPCAPPALTTDPAITFQGVATVTVKNQGLPHPQDGCPDGNPVNPANGNKIQTETDYVGTGYFPLRLVRYYNGMPQGMALSLGPNWQTNYDARLSDNVISSVRVITAMRPDGKWLEFRLTGNEWLGDPDVRLRLSELTDGSGTQTGWRLLREEEDVREDYDLAGNLTAVVDRVGNTHVVARDQIGRVATVTDSAGKQLVFVYDANSLLTSVTTPAGTQIDYIIASVPGSLSGLTEVHYPGGTTRKYTYVAPMRLTGIIDENGHQYATWTYDAQGRVTQLQHAGGADAVSFDYTTTDAPVVTDALGATRAYQYQTQFGTKKRVSVSGDASGSCVPATTFDSNGFVASRTDWVGNRTNYVHNARGLETSRTEGLTSAGASTSQTRTISTQWDANFRLPAGIAEPLRITTNVYDPDGTQCGARGRLCSKTIQATNDTDGSQGFSATPVGTPRSWTYTYNANGSVLTVDGPRTTVSDVTTYTYYANNDLDLGKRGNVASIADAAGHVTSILAYNADGRPLTIVDPNGLTTTLVYDLRQRLISRTVGSETTSYEYDGVGQVTKITLPDGSYLTYTYDDAHRMTGMQDNLGNRIAYTLDAMGNRTQEQVFDPVNALAQSRGRVFNNLNRLYQEIGAAAQVTQYAYDTQGNVTSVQDPLNKVTSNAYDPLNRLRQVTDPALGVTQYAYNGLDALTAVTDPRGLATAYTVDGLGNLTLQQSPDTGNTSNTYDPAGNLLTQTDAKAQVTTYAYDALNRVTLITFHDGSKQSYAYDQGTYGLGRLTSITETDPANAVTSVIAYAYDQHGRVISDTRTIAGQSYVTAYSYDSFGRMDGMTYPSGRTVTYGFDALGRVSQVSTTKPGDAPQVVVQNVSYHPFGGVTSFTFGNGQLYTRTVDQDGRIATYTLGGAPFSIAYDAASRITSITEVTNPSNANTYGYDALDRLTSAVLPTSSYGYSYDAVGNRLSKTVGASADTYAYESVSNRLASLTPATGPVRSFSVDANGSTVADGFNTYAYDARGRIVQVTTVAGATGYQVNALGQRVRKANATGDTIFFYDTRGHLIAETDPGGTLKREYIYLGDMPIGVVQ